MGAFSTLWVSREAAIAKLGEIQFGGMTDDMLQTLLDRAYEGRLRNFRISYAAQDDAELARL